MSTCVVKWSQVKDLCVPTQRALGWDWALFKLEHFVTLAGAQAYMLRKPVPFVGYRGRYYIVDHHHTLVWSASASALCSWVVRAAKVPRCYELVQGSGATQRFVPGNSDV